VQAALPPRAKRIARRPNGITWPSGQLAPRATTIARRANGPGALAHAIALLVVPFAPSASRMTLRAILSAVRAIPFARVHEAFARRVQGLAPGSHAFTPRPHRPSRSSKPRDSASKAMDPRDLWPCLTLPTTLTRRVGPVPVVVNAFTVRVRHVPPRGTPGTLAIHGLTSPSHDPYSQRQAPYPSKETS
jgi:hypothetical protein